MSTACKAKSLSQVQRCPPKPGSPLLMHEVPVIHSPQPRRPLKRAILEVEDPDTPEVYTVKRQCLASLCSSEPLVRSRSDSYLSSTMSSRPSRESRKPKRYSESDTDTSGTNNIRSFISLPPSPSTSASSVASFRSSSSTPYTSHVPERPASRTQKLSYRQDLRWNGIIIDPVPASDAVLHYGAGILNRERSSPGLSQSQAQAAVNHMKNLQHAADEDTVKDGYLEFGIVPYPSSLPQIARGCNLPFDPSALPHLPMAPPLGLPKPDHHYSFKETQFTVEQDAKQSSATLRSYSTPSSSGRWPFFIIEFKSQAKGGTIWAAENQVATGGALLVNSMEKLFALVREHCEEIDSIVFSCTMDAKNAAFWIHYCERESRQFCSVEIEQFSMRRARDVIACRNTIMNIMNWGVEDRLPNILTTLDAITLEYLRGTEKAQQARSATDQPINKRRH